VQKPFPTTTPTVGRMKGIRALLIVFLVLCVCYLEPVYAPHTKPPSSTTTTTTTIPISGGITKTKSKDKWTKPIKEAIANGKFGIWEKVTNNRGDDATAMMEPYSEKPFVDLSPFSYSDPAHVTTAPSFLIKARVSFDPNKVKLKGTGKISYERSHQNDEAYDSYDATTKAQILKWEEGVPRTWHHTHELEWDKPAGKWYGYMVLALRSTHVGFGGHSGSADKFAKYTLWKAGTLPTKFATPELVAEFTKMHTEEKS